jgi:hypothetical protein
MHILLVVVKREVLAQLPRVPTRARHRRGFFVLCSARKRNTSQLLLKAQASEVSDDQVNAQAIKELWAGPSHSHLVREQPKTVLELY